MTFPADVACPIDGRPSWLTCWIVWALGTKSTVTASCSPGTCSVAVSPVSRTSSSRCGRATRRTSSRQDGVRETHDVDAEAVPAGLGVVLDETRRRQGPELSRDGARREAGQPCELVRADVAGVRERVEDRDRPLRRPDAAAGRLTCACHGR
jgi:hypothetical protein